MPEVQSGDLLALLSVGAYGYVPASIYHTRRRPVEVVLCLAVFWRPLFRQSDLAFHKQVPGDSRRSCIGLAAADADRVITAGNDRKAVLRHHAHISILQLKMNL